MADNVNFYEWLGLPVDKFESDPAKLSPILEKYITDCNSSKDLSKQSRAAIYKDQMRAAINDPVVWMQIYEDFKKLIEERISDDLMMCADSNKEVDAANISSIAAKYKVTIPYVENIAISNGYKPIKLIPDPISEPKFTLKDIEPKCKNELISPQRALKELGYANLIELIDKELNSHTDIHTVKKDRVIEALNEIKKAWNRISGSSEKYQQKAHIEKICSGMLNFFKKYDISDYIAFLIWNEINDILNALRSKITVFGRSSLNNQYYNKAIDDIYSALGDREKAKAILNAFCDEKGISYPKPVPNIAVCPFCSNNFEKKNPIQSSCPSCNRSFIVVCPKCGKNKNMLAESICDGIDLLQYPILERQLKSVEDIIDSLDLEAIKIKINEINRKWPGFPACAELSNKCKSLEATYGAELKKLTSLIKSKQFYAAKIICDRLGVSFPKFKSANAEVYNTIVSADKQYESVKKEKDPDKQVELLLGVLDMVSDHRDANAEIKKFKLAPIQMLQSSISTDSSAIVLSWVSQNKPNSVIYSIRRKTNTPVTNHDDGEEIATTQSTSFSDSDIKEGTVYFYAVFAKRGPLQTPIQSTPDGLVLLKKPEASVTSKDSAVSVSWQPSMGAIKAFISENPISRYGEGKPCTGISQSGLDLEHLINGKKYYIGLVKVICHMGKEYRSELSVYSFTPMEAIVSPMISKSIGQADGDYIITHTNPIGTSILELYCSPTLANITCNSSMNYSELRKYLRKAVVSDKGNNSYVINVSGVSELYVYPVVCRGEVATVGNYLCLRYAKSIRVTQCIISANKLRMYIDKWVDDADALLICYKNDDYPQSIDDIDKRISVSRNEYNRTRLLEIQNVKNQKYYISIFARKIGEYIPVCNYFFDNSSRESVTVYYSFHVSWGHLSISFESKSQFLPAIDVCINNGSVPLTKLNGTVVYTIPEGQKGNSSINIPNYKVKNNTFGKLFTDTPGYVLLLQSGDGRIR